MSSKSSQYPRKLSLTSKATTGSRHQPYHKDHPRSTRGHLLTSSSSSKLSTPSVISAPTSSSVESGRSRPSTVRDVILEDIHAKFPKFVPQHDFEIVALMDGRFKGPEEELRAWLDAELAQMARMYGDARQSIESDAREMLNAPASSITGRKPRPGDENVFVREIPRSEYSIRLFPGNPALREFCLDFVETRTGRAVNSPFKFELWSTGTPTSPHSFGPLRSLERSFGKAHRDILPGEEKFVLTDGTTYVLKRPGHKPVRFTVPTRASALAEFEAFDGYELDLPERIR